MQTKALGQGETTFVKPRELVGQTFKITDVQHGARSEKAKLGDAEVLYFHLDGKRTMSVGATTSTISQQIARMGGVSAIDTNAIYSIEETKNKKTGKPNYRLVQVIDVA